VVVVVVVLLVGGSAGGSVAVCAMAGLETPAIKPTNKLLIEITVVSFMMSSPSSPGRRRSRAAPTARPNAFVCVDVSA
jgi:hypothetical protein